MEPSPTPRLRKPSPLAGAEQRAKVPSSSSEERTPLGVCSSGVKEVTAEPSLSGSRSTDFATQCVALTPRLRAYAIALLKNRDAAEDLVQDTLVRALTKQRLWTSGTDLRAWLFTIMYNLRASYFRKKRIENQHHIYDADVTLTPARERADIGVIVRDAKKALAALPRPQREVLLLAGIEGLSYEEISTRSGVRLNTVRSSLSRARAKVKRAADENYGEVIPNYERMELGIFREYNQYRTNIRGRSRYFATLQEARDARAA